MQMWYKLLLFCAKVYDIYSLDLQPFLTILASCTYEILASYSVNHKLFISLNVYAQRFAIYGTILHRVNEDMQRNLFFSELFFF